jgi:hypothetical protein
VTPAAVRASAWSRARALAERTPPARNRYVDFLRAASIGVVVIGHWLMAAPALRGEAFSLGDMLRVASWSQWLTWIFQVMPLFFLVGGYANGASWEAARRDGLGYDAWLAARLQRLVLPIVPLVIFWALLAVGAAQMGAPSGLVGVGSQVAFVPVWFLAVYVMVVVVAPATQAAWRRYRMASFWVLAAGATAVDAIAFGFDLPGLRRANYAFVWLGVHHLGHLWRDGRLRGPVRALAWGAGGLALLSLLVGAAGYPVSMISVPGEELSNSKPPTLALLALGVFHGGLVLAMEGPARRWLERGPAWTATVLVNASIMTVYLWHATAMVLLVALLYALGGFGLGAEPGSGAWWATRPIWIGVLTVGLLAFVALLGRFERFGQVQPDSPPPAWRSVVCAVAVCAGLSALTLGGITAGGPLGLRLGMVLLVLGGGALIAIGRPLGSFRLRAP